MDKETAEKNLEIVLKQIGLLERCIGHATSNRDALDPGSTVLDKYNSALEELKNDVLDYRDISKMNH